jgi:peptidoglycan L-alanyl-D-glutamate endopeptidase CwlK
MARFSWDSWHKLSTCDNRIKFLFGEVIKYYDCTIIEGARSQDRQEELYRQGLSKLHFPKSKHNAQPLSLAVDVIPFPIDWSDSEQMLHFAGFVQGLGLYHGINIRWGGSWEGIGKLNKDYYKNPFNDLVHFELVTKQ